MDPIAHDDADEWWKAIWSDADVTRHLPGREPRPRATIPNAIDRWLAQPYGLWILRDKSSDALVGHCGLVVNEPPQVELVYALARNAWGRGLATEAAGRATNYAFDETEGIDELVAFVFPENAASMRVLEKLGFVREGETRRFDADLARFAKRR